MRDVGIVGFVVLTASFLAACGVVWKSIKSLWRTVRDLERRLQKLHDMTDEEKRNGTSPDG